MSVESPAGEGPAEEIFRVKPRFPLRVAKVQRPLLPDETVHRDRLLDWMQARIRRRAIFVIAEAGFGKTTLVADFVRQSRLRTFWYRLDEDDTDGLVFMRYLTASCRQVNQGLLPRTAALLAEPALEPDHAARVAEALFEEIETLGEIPSALVLDDYHMAEAVPSIRPLVERLVDRAPAGLALIFMSRRMPELSIATLRARGQTAELGREDLRFDESETGRLFHQSNHPLDPDVLHDLQTRTEGWAASLQLAKTAVEGRSMPQVRAFVRSLSGAEGDLYDYLAEEVVGDLPSDLREFLLRIALLEDVEPTIAGVAASVPAPEARRFLVTSQRIGLLSKSNGADGSWRPHPLVREFLLAHLVAELGETGVADLHRQLAQALEGGSWRLGARHWAAAGDGHHVRRVVCAAVPAIIATGDLAAAEELITRFPDPEPNPWFEIIRARGLASAGLNADGLQVVLRAQDLAATLPPNKTLSRLLALTIMSLGLMARDLSAHDLGLRQLIGCDDAELAAIADAGGRMLQSSESGSLDGLCSALAHAASISHSLKHPRHEGISLLNLALAELARGNHAAAAQVGLEALALVTRVGDSGDVAAAHLNTARAIAHLRGYSAWGPHVEAVIDAKVGWVDPDTIAEAAEIHAMYGDPSHAIRIMKNLIAEDSHLAESPYCIQVGARIEMMRGDSTTALRMLDSVPMAPLAPGFRSEVMALQMQVRAFADPGDPCMRRDFGLAMEFAAAQQAWFWWRSLSLSSALTSPSSNLIAHLHMFGGEDAAALSVQAELVLRKLNELDQTCLALVRNEATVRPERWRWAIRRYLTSGREEPQLSVRRAVELLEGIGTADDVRLLRSIARVKVRKIPDAGKALVRRLAPVAVVNDLGRIAIHVGDRAVLGTDIRKKVLSLLAFLLTRPQFTASREQVTEALWPEMDPDAAANSLNQTSYFLRQVFEPRDEDDASANYLCSRGDLIWLDPELVISRSTRCLEILSAIRRSSDPALVTELAEAYTGRFATDFIYEEWASPFRDCLHASYLDRMERSISADIATGAFERALMLSQLALQADPDAEGIELCLLRLYRLTGATGAAVEQYAHYASVLRDQLGVEPPPLDLI